MSNRGASKSSRMNRPTSPSSHRVQTRSRSRISSANLTVNDGNLDVNADKPSITSDKERVSRVSKLKELTDLKESATNPLSKRKNVTVQQLPTPPRVSPRESSPSVGVESPLNICIVSDFFLPRLGGVELHQYQIAQALIARGHKVIIITGTYGSDFQRQGVRYLSNGLKVYYCPQLSFHNQVSIPTLLNFLPLFRSIVIRERIQVVHGHQTTSPLSHQCLLYAKVCGLRGVYTDHSLFNLGSGPSILVNKLMAFTLCNTDHVVCVSYTLKENLVLRAGLDAECVSVIPNAIDHTKFLPDLSKREDIYVKKEMEETQTVKRTRASRSLTDTHSVNVNVNANANANSNANTKKEITIVVLSRLVYRKGVSLVMNAIPLICAKHPHVKFLIGGDGPHKILIVEMVERLNLQSRVELLGEVSHRDVASVLNQGHIFLNASLTEAFCIAILEAVACGLFVVSTRVGGVPEILPKDMIEFADPCVEDIVSAVDRAIDRVPFIDPLSLHDRVAVMYSWHQVAARTEKVYRKTLKLPQRGIMDVMQSYWNQPQSFFSRPLFAGVALLGKLALNLCEWLLPESDIDIVPDFNRDVNALMDEDDECVD